MGHPQAVLVPAQEADLAAEGQYMPYTAYDAGPAVDVQYLPVSFHLCHAPPVLESL